MPQDAVIPQLQVRREKEHFNRKEAAAYLTRMGCPISPRTLEQKALKNNAGGGPPYTRFGWKTIVYKREDLDRWMEKQGERVE